jgi:hypothetical protein
MHTETNVQYQSNDGIGEEERTEKIQWPGGAIFEVVWVVPDI